MWHASGHALRATQSGKEGFMKLQAPSTRSFMRYGAIVALFIAAAFLVVARAAAQAMF
jgi:hypothetical protein